jgi:membrane-bound serine protease (ClpP class)
MKKMRLILTLFALALLFLPPLHAAADGQSVLILTLDGAIAPAAREYLRRGIQTAEQTGAEAIILQMNTPGGSIDTMNAMVQDIRDSSVPVVVYVAPRGAWAASAGTIITLAGHVAAMAPETAIGAASPVGSSGEDLGTTMESKVKNMLKATAASLAERRGPEAVALAQDTIENASAVSASVALEAGLIDFVATDLDDLLRQLDGFTVELATGKRTLHTAEAATQTLSMSFIEQLLDVLTNANIVFLLLSIGVQAIIIEISSPGGWVAGFIGAVCLALAGYGLGFLPVNWFGLLFLMIAFVLFIVDIKAPTHGGLTAAGIGSFIVGALVLFNSPGTPSFQRVSLPLVIMVGVIIGLSFAIIVGFALRAQKRPILTGQESMAHQGGVAVSDIAPTGQVQSAGELWSAQTAEGAGKIRKGEHVEVVKVEGLRLIVRKKG